MAKRKEKKPFDIKEQRFYKYAVECAKDGDLKVGEWVRKQSKEWINIVDGNDNIAYFDTKKASKITKVLKLIIHPDVQKNMYIALENYALLFIFALFCTLKRVDNTYYYSTGLLEIARKNYKTFTSAVCFIIGLIILPPYSRTYSVAPDLKLSSELKVAIFKIIKSSPLLVSQFKLLRSEVRCILTSTEYYPLAYSNDRLDGKLAHLYLADEAGAMDAYPIEAMRSSQINLVNCFGIIISTQYPNDVNGFISEVDYAKRQLNGDRSLPLRTFALLYEPDEDIQQEWETNDYCIYQANPVAVDRPQFFENLKASRELAILYESKRENYVCKHLNIKYKGIGSENFVNIQQVIKCKRPFNNKNWYKKKVYLGLDLSLSEDNTAVAMICVEGNKIQAKVWGFIPKLAKQRKTKKEKVNYDMHIHQGECFECGDEVISYNFIEDFILNLKSTYNVDIQGVGYDRYNAISTVQKLEKEGLECVALKQHSSVLHPATKRLKEAILSGTFEYDENRLLEINFENARCKEDTNLNKYVCKKSSSGKVDMVVALINALALQGIVEIENENKKMDWLFQ